MRKILLQNNLPNSMQNAVAKVRNSKNQVLNEKVEIRKDKTAKIYGQ